MEENKVPMEKVDINDMSAKPEVDETALSVDLLCGTTVSFDVDKMDWGEMYNRIPEMDENILTLKTMIYDLIRMEPGDLRDGAALSIFGNADDFLKSVKIEDLNYDVRPGLTMYEKALLICMDCVLILNTITAYAQVYALSRVNTDALIDDIMSTASVGAEELNDMINKAKELVDENPMPLEQETYGSDDDEEIQYPSDANGEEVL